MNGFAGENMANEAVLVTGGGRRLGRHIAIALGRMGFPVAVHWSSSRDGALSAVDEIRAARGTAWDIKADLLSPDGPEYLVEAAATNGSMPIRHLVHAAALFEFDAPEAFTDDAWERHMGLNARAGIRLAVRLHEHLAGEQGSAVFVLDQKLWNLHSDFFTYTLAKQALHGSMPMLARSLAPGMRINGVAPGFTLSNPGESPEVIRAYARTLPLRMTADPDDVAAAIGFLLRARTVTNQTILVDGGEHLVPVNCDPMFTAAIKPQA